MITLFYIFLFIIVAAAFYLWYVYGKEEKLNPVVTFYPPKDLTPAEIGYIYDDKVDDRDVISLIFYWADKGYIKIKCISDKDIQLVKIKGLPENAKRYEELLFENIFGEDEIGLAFRKDSIFSYEQEIFGNSDIAQLDNWKKRRNNSITMNIIKRRVRVICRDYQRIYSDNSLKALKAVRIFIFLIPVVCYLIFRYGLILWSEHIYAGFAAAFFVFGMNTILFTIAFEDLIQKELWKANKENKKEGISSLFMLCMGTIGLAATCGLISKSFVLGIAVVVSLIILEVISWNMRKLSTYSRRLKEEILGFKNFLEYAEKDRIERLVEENPEYYYNILPYAYVLEVTDKWAEKFEDFNLVSFIKHCFEKK